MATRQKQERRQKALQLVSVLLLFLLLISMLITETARFFGDVSTERAQTGSITFRMTLQGYLLRDEAALPVSCNGPVEHLVANGTPVQAGDLVAKAYTDESDAQANRARAEGLYAEIARLEAGLAQTEAWQALYGAAYYELMQALSAGDLAAAQALDDALLVSLGARDAADADSVTHIEKRIREMRDELAYLVKYDTSPEEVCTQTQGIYYGSADGYEAALGTAALATLTPESLSALLSQKEPVGALAGRVITADRFGIAVPCTGETASALTEGQSYRLRVGGATLELLLSRVSRSEDGQGALLLFEGEQLPASLCEGRLVSVTVDTKTAFGIKVPGTALREIDGATGVYVLEGGVAVFKRVRAASHLDDGCYLAEVHDGPSEKDAFLQVGDLILVTTRRIYEGKKLN